MKPGSTHAGARRSKDDAQDETKSFNRPVENARVFATAGRFSASRSHRARRLDADSG
jgi:hypothetical protein